MSDLFRVLISDSMSPRATEVLQASPAVEVDVRAGLAASDLLATIGDYHGLIVRSRTKVTAEVLDAARNLKIVGRAGIGVDNIDVAAASRRGVLVENAPSGNSITTAEHAISLLCSLSRHIPQATASMKAGKWEKKKLEGRELCGKNIGVIGLGNIGRLVAERARGLKMKVLGFDPFISRDAAARLGVELLSFDELLSRADFMTVHTPLTDETRGLLGAKAFAKVKPGLLLVNAARGGIVDEAALLGALESGQVGGAALDVFETEPPAAGDALVAHPNVICTPHLGASTGEAQDKVAVEIAEQLVAFAERGEIRNAINIVALPPDVSEYMAPWLKLATSLGALAAQRMLSAPDAPSSIDHVEVEISGDPAEQGEEAIVNAVLVGLLHSFVEAPVNAVNAGVLAAERGLAVDQTRRSLDRDLTASVGVRASTNGKSAYVKGTLYHVGNRVEPRIVQLDEIKVEAPAADHLLVVRNRDTPGVIGKVGGLLGGRSVNVNSLHVGADTDKGVAIALWSVSPALDEELLDAIRAVDEVIAAELVSL